VTDLDTLFKDLARAGSSAATQQLLSELPAQPRRRSRRVFAIVASTAAVALVIAGVAWLPGGSGRSDRNAAGNGCVATRPTWMIRVAAGGSIDAAMASARARLHAAGVAGSCVVATSDREAVVATGGTPLRELDADVLQPLTFNRVLIAQQPCDTRPPLGAVAIPGPLVTLLGSAPQGPGSGICYSIERPGLALDGHVLRATVVTLAGGQGIELSLDPEATAALSDVTATMSALRPPQDQLAIVRGSSALASPHISSRISDGRLQITGDFTRPDATELAKELTAPAYPIGTTIVAIPAESGSPQSAAL
jgi:preprotein translocase subunit SecD